MFVAATLAFSLAVSGSGENEVDLSAEVEQIASAHDLCESKGGAGLRPLADDDPYFSKVREYWNTAGKKQGVTFEQSFFAQVSTSGELTGTFVQYAVPDRAVERGIKQESCIIHFPDSPPPRVSNAALARFAGNQPKEQLIPVAYDETTWVVQLPETSNYDWLSVTMFDPRLAKRAPEATHPFRGTQYRFLRQEF